MEHPSEVFLGIDEQAEKNKKNTNKNLYRITKYFINYLFFFLHSQGIKNLPDQIPDLLLFAISSNFT